MATIKLEMNHSKKFETEKEYYKSLKYEEKAEVVHYIVEYLKKYKMEKQCLEERIQKVIIKRNVLVILKNTAEYGLFLFLYESISKIDGFKEILENSEKIKTRYKNEKTLEQARIRVNSMLTEHIERANCVDKREYTMKKYLNEETRSNKKNEEILIKIAIEEVTKMIKKKIYLFGLKHITNERMQEVLDKKLDKILS